jgi:bifunctional non-homologous end joining protein LigD
MMAPNKNAIVALSLRDPTLTVSLPLTWEEVAAAREPSAFDAHADTRVLHRASKLFEPVVESSQALPLGEPWAETPHAAGPDWRHDGRRLRVRCVVGGWAPPEGESDAHMGYVLLGLYYLGELAYVGKTPIDSDRRHEMYVKVAEHRAGEPPFVSLPRPLRGAHWARPDLVCAVECSGLTGGPDLRAPRYLGLVPEADPRDCTLEQLER